MRRRNSTPPIGFEVLKTVVLNSPTRFFCDSCDKYIPSTMPWICGHCGHNHTEVRLYSFLFKCKECKRRPDAIECPHCKTVWGFSKVSEIKHVARRIPTAPSPTTAETKSEKGKRVHEERMQKLEREKAEAELFQKIKDLRDKSAPLQEKAFKKVQEEILEDFSKLFATGTTTDYLRQQFAIEYKNNPEMLKRINDWLRQIEIDRA